MENFTRPKNLTENLQGLKGKKNLKTKNEVLNIHKDRLLNKHKIE